MGGQGSRTEPLPVSVCVPWQKSAETLNTEMQNVSQAFVQLNEQVASQEGYDLRQHPDTGTQPARSTQEIYETKTKLRCESERGGQGLAARGEGAAPDPSAVPTGHPGGGCTSGAGAAQAVEGSSCPPAVIQRGLQRCTKQFQHMYKKCIKQVTMPLVKHFICLPMQFGFLCHSVKRR